MKSTESMRWILVGG